MINHDPDLRGFTLVEILVVVAIIGILIGLTLPAVQMIRESSRRATCANNMRNIAIATQNFESSNRHLPTGVFAKDHLSYPSMSWLVQLLPHLERPDVWEQSQRDYESGTSPFTGHIGLQTNVGIFNCPSYPFSGAPQYTHQNRLVALTNYVGINGTDFQSLDGCYFTDSETRFAEISDGLSNTLIAGERPPSTDFWYGWWYAGVGQKGSGSPDMLLGMREINDNAVNAGSCSDGPFQFGPGTLKEQCDVFHFWSLHPGGSNFCAADGSVHFINYNHSSVMQELGTIAGTETATIPR